VQCGSIYGVLEGIYQDLTTLRCSKNPTSSERLLGCSSREMVHISNEARVDLISLRLPYILDVYLRSLCPIPYSSKPSSIAYRGLRHPRHHIMAPMYEMSRTRLITPYEKPKNPTNDPCPFLPYHLNVNRNPPSSNAGK